MALAAVVSRRPAAGATGGVARPSRSTAPVQLALFVTVLVDVVRPGLGLVTCGAGDFSGSIVRDAYAETPAEKRRPYFVETEYGDVVGRARSYRDGAVLLAVHHGLAAETVSVVVEHERDDRS